MTGQEFEKIESHFKTFKNPERSIKMEKYMKHKFSFLGITSPLRREIMKDVFKGKKWDRYEAMEFAKHSWGSDYREIQYVGIDVLSRFKNKLGKDQLDDIEFLLVNKSWWDSIDGLASNPVGSILKTDKDLQWIWATKWAESDNFWLQRTAILHQLKYKLDLDIEIMEYTISKANGTKEFFLNKAIGWILREYGKVNPNYVIEYCKTHKLSNLSLREALKNIK